MRAAIYARYSTDLQSPTSIEDQVTACRRAAERHGYTVLEDQIYFDSAVSGSRDDRVSLNTLMEAANNGAFDVLLVDDLSRLSRNQIKALTIFSQFQFMGLTILSVSDNIDTSDERSFLPVATKSMFNHMMLYDIRDKTLRGQKGRKERGYFVGEGTFGYKSFPVGKIYVDRKGQQRPEGYDMQINPQEAAVVRCVFEEYADGVSLTRIIKRLNQDRTPTRKGNVGKWATNPVFGMVRNEKYIGKWVWNRRGCRREPITGKVRTYEKPQSEWVVITREDLRIIPQELWERVRKRLDENRRVWPGGKGRRGFHGQKGNAKAIYPQELLSSAMTCGVCGGTIAKVSGKDRGYYGCLNAARRSCGNRTLVRKTIAERIILGAVYGKISDAEALSYLFHRVETLTAKELAKSPETILRKEAEHTDEKRKRDNLLKFIMEGKAGHLKSVADSLELCEKNVDRLGIELEALRMSDKRRFKSPPKEWILERVTDFKGILEQKTERAALLLRKLLGKIRLDPVTPLKGRPYYHATSTLDALALVEHKTQEPGPPAKGSPGSTTFRWWALQDLNL